MTSTDVPITALIDLTITLYIIYSIYKLSKRIDVERRNRKALDSKFRAFITQYGPFLEGLRKERFQEQTGE